MVLGLYLFRHGETEYNVKHDEIIGGQSNFIDLSEKGIQQAALLGQKLRREGVHFNEIYSSTATRAKRTAEIVCDVIGFPVGQIISVKDLLELSQGDWEGGRRTEHHTPNILEQMRTEHWEFRPPNGESQKDVEERVYTWIERQVINGRGSNHLNVGIFGHGVATKCLFRRIMGSDPRLTYRINIDNCSITEFKYAHSGHHQGWSLVRLNERLGKHMGNY